MHYMKNVKDRKFKAQMMGMSPRMIEKIDPRRLQEILDSLLIQEDHNAIANAPEYCIHQEFHHSYVNPYDDNDAIRPFPPRNRPYSDNEDVNQSNAMRNEESYGERVRSEW